MLHRDYTITANTMRAIVPTSLSNVSFGTVYNMKTSDLRARFSFPPNSTPNIFETK